MARDAAPTPAPTPTEPVASGRANFDRLAEAFDRIRRASISDRPRLLAELDRVDRAVAAEVGELLRFHDAGSDALDAGVIRASTESIGPYRLVRRLGEGGMGTVWLAEQERPVRRTVALKVIKAGMDTRAVVRRFELERQVLARMDHPGIACVLDAGSTPDGRPYFAMEFVAGQPVLSWCDERRLSVRDRVRLFIGICRTVEHAHQKGVLHRDLKPSNVLVTEVDGAPLPKVIDFGVAKALDDPDDGATLLTQPGSVVGTPEYMSPEQATPGGDVDTRADIYSLGLVLYELLTGTTPRKLSRTTSRRGATLGTITGMLLGDQPVRPSSAIEGAEPLLTDAVAERRATDARGLRRTLRGDLDWIVLRAIAPDRDRRYGTVAALADDLARSLAFEPVDARPPSVTYLARLFARRHVGGLVATALVLAALVAGLAVAIDGWRDARTERDAALQANERERATAKSLADRLHESVIEQGLAAARAGDVRSARVLLWSAALERPDSVAAQWALRECSLRHPVLVSIPLFETPPFAVAELDDDRAVLALQASPPVIVDRRRAEVIESLPGPPIDAVDLALSPDRRWLVVGTESGDVHAWDLASHASLGVVATHGPKGTGGRGAFVGASTGEACFLSGGEDGRLVEISLLDRSSRELSLDRGQRGTSPVTRLATHASGRWAAGFADGSVVTGGAGAPSIAVESHDSAVIALAFDAAGERLVSGGLDRSIVLHGVSPADTIRRWEPRLGTIRDLLFFDHDTVLVAGWWEVSRLDVNADAAIPMLSDAAWRMALSRDRRTLILVMGSSGSLREWSLEPGIDAARHRATPPAPPHAWFAATPSPIVARRVGEHMRLAVAGCRDGEVIVEHVDGRAVALFDDYRPGSRQTVAINEARSLMAYTAVGGGVRVRTLDGRFDRLLCADELREILALQFDPTGDRIAVAARGGRVRLFDLARDAETIVPTPSTVFHAEFTPDGEELLGGTWRGTIERISRDARLAPPLRGHSRMVTAMAIDDDAPTMLVTGDAAGAVHVNDLTSERRVLAITPFKPASAIRAIELEEAGDLLRVTAADGRHAWWRWSEVDRWIAANGAHERTIAGRSAAQR